MKTVFDLFDVEEGGRRRARARPRLVVEGRVVFSSVIAMYLCPWRRRGGRILGATLHVRLAVGREVPTGTIVAVNVSRPKTVPIVGWGMVTRGVRPVRQLKRDSELASWQPRSEPPPPEYVDPILGRLVLEREGWLTTRRAVGDVEYEATIAVRDFGDAKSTAVDVKKGRVAVLHAEGLLPVLLDRVTARMHPLYIRVWRDERYPYTAGDFRAMLKLSSITFQHDRTTVRFGIGSLFVDHGIEVRLARKRISEIGLA